MSQKNPSCMRTKTNAILFGCVAAWFFGYSAKAQLTIFNDRGSLQQALGTTAAFDNFSRYSSGQIGQGIRLGDFAYGFLPSATLPMIAPDGSGNQVLGGAPYRVFVGGDQVTLT